MEAISPIRNFVPVCWFGLKCLGIVEIKDHPFWRFFRIAHIIFTIFVIYHLTILTICQMIVYSDLSNIREFGSGMHQAIMNTVVALMATWMAVKRNDIKHIIEYINSNIIFYSARGLTNTTMMRCYKFNNLFSLILLVWSLSATQQTALTPLFFGDGEYPLPITVTYPFDLKNYYAIVYFLQYCLHVFISLTYTTFIFLVACPCILLTGQVDLLCCSLSNIRFTAMLRRGVSHDALVEHFLSQRHERYDKMKYYCATIEMKDTEYHYNKRIADADFQDSIMLTTDLYSKEFDQDTEKALIECIIMHQKITVMFEKFQEFVAIMVMFKIINITVHQCILLYAFSVTLDSEILQYYLLTVADMACFTYFAHQLMLESYKIPDALYESQWWACGNRAARLVLTYMGTCKNPYIITGGKIFDMTLNVFIGVLKAAYTFFTFTRNMQTK